MMDTFVEKKKVAILTENGFEEDELTGPLKALRDAGAWAGIVSPQPDKVTGWKNRNWRIGLQAFNKKMTEEIKEGIHLTAKSN